VRILELSRPFHGLRLLLRAKPTDKSVGYSHSSASPTFEAKPRAANRLPTRYRVVVVTS